MPFLDSLPSDAKFINNNYNLIVDAIFGFSFKGDIRAPFGEVLEKIKNVKIPVCSIDIPSGFVIICFIKIVVY